VSLPTSWKRLGTGEGVGGRKDGLNMIIVVGGFVGFIGFCLLIYDVIQYEKNKKAQSAAPPPPPPTRVYPWKGK